MSVNAANDVAGQDPAVNPANPQNVGLQAHKGINSHQLISTTFAVIVMLLELRLMCFSSLFFET